MKKERFPSFIKPMLATLSKPPFPQEGWEYEDKIDGIRCLTFCKNGAIRMVSRNEHVLTEKYPNIAQALQQQAHHQFIIDGEIAALDSVGISKFQLLQDVQKSAHSSLIAYFIFDILHLNGYSTRSLPLSERKKLLKKLFIFDKKLVFIEPLVGDGATLFKKACKIQEEGVIAKRISSAYVSKRSSDWLKFKCQQEQELVIAGYTKPRGSRTDFGALLVGYYEKGKLMYAGKVGTGYTHAALHMLKKKMDPFRTTRCPFTNYDDAEVDVIWLKPKLAGRFAFAEWTNAGKLRVGRFKGLYTEKPPHKIVREVPKSSKRAEK